MEMEFVVVDVSSLYNLMLGQSLLHGMKVIASTYHQVVRFIERYDWQENIKGDQVASKECHFNVVHIKGKASRCNGDGGNRGLDF